jgi:hypothetical protein
VLLLFTCGQVLACRQGEQTGARGPRQDGVVVERDTARRETTYKISSGSCRISWTVYESEVNRGVVRHRSDCGLTLGEQAPLIGKLLRKALEFRDDAASFRTLTWGRLYPDDAREVTLPLRLALAAKRSTDWDPVRGVPRGGDINGWIRKLANEALIYKELRPVFEASGLEIRLAAVEKVLVQRAKLLPFFPMLREAGVQPEDKVPFDCQTWFSVQPVGGPHR